MVQAQNGDAKLQILQTQGILVQGSFVNLFVKPLVLHFFYPLPNGNILVIAHLISLSFKLSFKEGNNVTFH